jgi:DNA polymerase-1
LLQVHDELVLEVNEKQIEDVAMLVKDVMENIVDLEVKMLAEIGIGDTWTTAH